MTPDLLAAWSPDVDEPPVTTTRRREVVDIDTLDDGRCKASSWRGRIPRRPDYESHFGPGGFNRCVGPDDHVNRLHKDEWGNVFKTDPFRVVRREATP